MAKPRIFISSTFYDLKQIRVELDKFIVSLGYEPVRNEEGNIPYGKDQALQDYCYKEISNVDILLLIVGNKYGSPSNNNDGENKYSVSQQELRTALKENKQVFIFIDKDVFTEYETYLLNKGQDGIHYRYVDNPEIYKFIEEIKGLKTNNNIKAFEGADDIIKYLKEQLAGLFKQFLIDSEKAREASVLKDIENTAKTLREMVDYLKSSSDEKDETIGQIVKLNHPIISKLKNMLSIKYNVYIDNKRDLGELMIARGYKKMIGLFVKSGIENLLKRS